MANDLTDLQFDTPAPAPAMVCVRPFPVELTRA